jgi:hypothetical protein
VIESSVKEPSIESFLLSQSEPSSLQLDEMLVAREPDDHLAGYSEVMWDVLRDWLTSELRVTLPSQSLGSTPSGCRVELWRTHDARCVKTSIEKRLAARTSLPSTDIFRNYGFSVADGANRYREGLDFFKRQSEHLQSDEQVLAICIRSLPPSLEDLDAGT